MAQRRLQEEEQLLSRGNVGTNVVTAQETDATKVVGPTVYIPVKVSGVLVEAMVDTGSQSSIISRDLLQRIGKHLRESGQPLPKLEKPSAHLFGKDGEGGGRELVITAQLLLTMEVDGKSASVCSAREPAKLFARYECIAAVGGDHASN